MRTKLILAAALAVVLIAAGCGDDDDETGGDAVAQITKEEWIAQAGEICRKGDAAMEAEAEKLFADFKGSEAEGERTFQAEVLVPGIVGQVSDIAALPVPEGDEEQVAAIIEAAESGLDQAAAEPSAIEEGGALDEATRLITDYGVTECG